MTCDLHVRETQPAVRAHSLVGLPPHLRRRIYLHTGVARLDGYPYTYFLDGRPQSRWGRSDSDFDAPPPRSFAGLLRCCRALYAETAALLYSANRFVIFYSRQGSFRHLRALSPTSLASLTSLRIVLNQSCPQTTNPAPPYCWCGGGHTLDYWADNHHCAMFSGGSHRRPLLDPAPGSDLTALTVAKQEVQAMMGEWHDAVAHISSHIGIGRLELFLEVTWSRQHCGYLVVRSLCACSSEPLCPPENHHGCRLNSCGPDFNVAVSFLFSASGCFCRRRHAAFSFACNCWAPPTNLFLVCRALYRDAQFVFFSGNRFIVHDFHALLPWDLPAVQREPSTPDAASTSTNTKYYPFERLAISEFLRDVVPTHCLANLRFLELVFPPYVPHGWPDSQHPAVRDWVATIDWLRGHINTPALTLRVVMADFWAGPLIGRRRMTKALADDIIRGYRCIINPLRPLVRGDGGLAGFYIQLAHPARWTRDVVRRAEHDPGFLDRMHRSLDLQAERDIRGPGANLDDPNRAEPSKSSWQRWYNRRDPDSD
ncbi:hypothetical protein C8A03DRAFT_48229 [Achaetomium macrosporum]|uniref:Uncharacterized protein n=1 Tax=Achaetomium macrosporum TaxID=79813 RepID=A0AAN7H393_9PEZI|nr:hypothetical protein C8A03DRAFT_48229 [Achaetomium macrosporum]